MTIFSVHETFLPLADFRRPDWPNRVPFAVLHWEFILLVKHLRIFCLKLIYNIIT